MWCSKLIIEKLEYMSTSNPLKAAMCRFNLTCIDSNSVFPRILEGVRTMVVCVLGVGFFFFGQGVFP